MSLTIPTAGSILRHNVRWQELETILAETESCARLAYDRGTLEIMTPLPEHEAYKETLGDLSQSPASFKTSMQAEGQFGKPSELGLENT